MANNLVNKEVGQAALLALPSSDGMLSFLAYTLVASAIFFAGFALVRYIVNKSKQRRPSSSSSSSATAHRRHSRKTKHKHKTNKATKIKDMAETTEEGERKLLAKERKKRAARRKHKHRKHHHSTVRSRRDRRQHRKDKIMMKAEDIDEDKSTNELAASNEESRSSSYASSHSQTMKHRHRQHQHRRHPKSTKVQRQRQQPTEEETSAESETFSTTTSSPKEDGPNSSNDTARLLSGRKRTKSKDKERDEVSRKNNKSIVVINRMNEIQSSVPAATAAAATPLPSICFDEEAGEGRPATTTTLYQSDKCRRRSYKQLKSLGPAGAAATAADATRRMSKGGTNSRRFNAILLSSLGGRRLSTNINNNIIVGRSSRAAKPKSKGDNRSLSESIFKCNLLKDKSIEQLPDTRGDIDENENGAAAVTVEEEEEEERKPYKPLDDRSDSDGRQPLLDGVAHSEQIYKRGEGGGRAAQKKKRRPKVTFSRNLTKAF